MERGAVLTMRRALFVSLLVCLSMAGSAGTQTVVLVVGAGSHVRDLEPIAIRKLFLGLPVFVEGAQLHPLRNRSDPQLEPIFFQQIVAMSEEAYDRQILIGVNRQGRLRPPEVTGAAALPPSGVSVPGAGRSILRP